MARDFIATPPRVVRNQKDFWLVLEWMRQELCRLIGELGVRWWFWWSANYQETDTLKAFNEFLRTWH